MTTRKYVYLIDSFVYFRVTIKIHILLWPHQFRRIIFDIMEAVSFICQEDSFVILCQTFLDNKYTVQNNCKTFQSVKTNTTCSFLCFTLFLNGLECLLNPMILFNSRSSKVKCAVSIISRPVSSCRYKNWFTLKQQTES